MKILAPLVILTLYLISLSYFLSWLIPEFSANVNAAFVHRAGGMFLLFTLGIYLFFFLLFKAFKGRHVAYQVTPEKFRVGDLILILLPLTPVVQYILNNQDILTRLGSLYVLAVFGVFSLVFVFLAPAALAVLVSRRTLMILGLALTYTLTNMASLSAAQHWFEQGSLVIQLALFAGIFLVGWGVYNLVGRRFMYFVVVLFFAATCANQIFWVKTAESPLESALEASPEVVGRAVIDSSGITHKLETILASKKVLTTPNIYLLIYDAYVNNETMLGYGIDNSAQEDYLQTMGFKIYPRTYSVAGFTIGTMGRLLDAGKDIFGSYRNSVSGNGIVHNLLRGLGYENIGIFYGDFFFQGIGSSYEASFPALKPTHRLLMKAIFMGEFRFDVGFDNPPRKEFEKYKRRVFKNMPPGPRFVYMHDELPGHSQNSGKCRPDEIPLFEKRLVQANAAMKQDVDLITQRDPGAIIIVAGDHGPYLTKNCSEIRDHYDISEITRLDVQDRFGTFLAIKWPNKRYTAYDDITVLQDIFPAIFAFLCEDETILEAKVKPVTWRGNTFSGASVENGILQGGVNDGEPLFLGWD
jgi:hypothetical protein